MDAFLLLVWALISRNGLGLEGIIAEKYCLIKQPWIIRGEVKSLGIENSRDSMHESTLECFARCFYYDHDPNKVASHGSVQALIVQRIGGGGGRVVKGAGMINGSPGFETCSVPPLSTISVCILRNL